MGSLKRRKDKVRENIKKRKILTLKINKMNNPIK